MAKKLLSMKTSWLPVAVVATAAFWMFFYFSKYWNHFVSSALSNTNISSKEIEIMIAQWDSQGSAFLFFLMIVIAVFSVMQLAVTNRLEASEKELIEENRMFQSGPVVSFRWKYEDGWPVIYASENIRDLFGYSLSDFKGHGGKMVFMDLIHPQDKDAVRKDARESLLSGQNQYVRQYRVLDKAGISRHVADYTIIVRKPDGSIGHFLGYLLDETDRVQAVQQLKVMATTDALTGVLNRTTFSKKLMDWISFEKPFGVIFVDLDRFKQINDTRGHGVGDKLLQALVKRIKENIGEYDLIARQGGDEFLIAAPMDDNVQRVSIIAELINKSFKYPFVIDGHVMRITASMGTSLFPNDITHPENDCMTVLDELLRKADIAMYAAKSEGRDTCAAYRQEMGDRINRDEIIRDALMMDMSNNYHGLTLHYQPQYKVNFVGNKQLVGLEALLRWNNRTLGAIMPGQFIQIAENNGLIADLGQWVMQTACKDIRRWLDSGLSLSGIKVSVNVSMEQFRKRNVVLVVRDSIKSQRLPKGVLEIELTESTLVSDVEQLRQEVSEIAAMGVSVAVDDFGTGYSNLRHLKSFDVSKIKIDKSFVDDVHRNEEDSAIAKAIIQMSKAMKIGVTAEGVENEDQIKALIAYGCCEFQGYFYSQPVTFEQAACLIEQSEQNKITSFAPCQSATDAMPVLQ